MNNVPMLERPKRLTDAITWLSAPLFWIIVAVIWGLSRG